MAAHLFALFAALLVFGPRALWRVTRTVVTIAHEAGHGFVALLTGRRLTGIRLHSDTSGVTVSVGRTTGPGMVLTALAGYLAPSLLGLAAAGVVRVELVEVALWAAIVLLLATLIYIRNVYGWIVVVLTGGLVGAVVWYGSPPLRIGFAEAAAWFLMFGGLRAVRELAAARRDQRRRGAQRTDSDADQLARLTGVSAWFWVGLFWLVAFVAVILGGWWLLGDVVQVAASRLGLDVIR
jgi:hypothetical protein